MTNRWKLDITDPNWFYGFIMGGVLALLITFIVLKIQFYQQPLTVEDIEFLYNNGSGLIYP